MEPSSQQSPRKAKGARLQVQPDHRTLTESFALEGKTGKSPWEEEVKGKREKGRAEGEEEEKRSKGPLCLLDTGSSPGAEDPCPTKEGMSRKSHFYTLDRVGTERSNQGWILTQVWSGLSHSPCAIPAPVTLAFSGLQSLLSSKCSFSSSRTSKLQIWRERKKTVWDSVGQGAGRSSQKFFKGEPHGRQCNLVKEGRPAADTQHPNTHPLGAPWSLLGISG